MLAACHSTSSVPNLLIPAHAPQRPRAQCVAAAAGSSRGSKRSTVSQGLVAVLGDELKVEKERYRTPEAVLDGPPNGFELQDRPNCITLLLARSYGDEDIFVEVDMNNQEDSSGEMEELEEDVLSPVVFTVNITKEEKMMTFQCEADSTDIVIRQVSLADAEELEEDEDGMEFAPYTGPVFDELDETLQQAFADYLEERGITADFGVYLMELVHDKLEVEYMNWLQRARSFVSS